MRKSIPRSTKDVILSCILTAVLSIPLTFLATEKYFSAQQNQKQDQGQNQSIIVNVNGKDISVDSEYVNNQEKRITELENTVKELSKNKSTIPVSKEIPDSNEDISVIDEVYLNELNVYNFQSIYRGEWRSETIPEWKFREDKTASGDTYENAVKMRTTFSDAESFVVDYYLKEKYTIFNGNFVLDEKSKSTPSIATLKIYGDNTVLYEYNNITGGFPAQNTGDIDVTNINILRFEFVSQSGGVGDYNDFGVVFFDSILK